MIKKHLVTCSVIVVLVIIFSINIFSTQPVKTVAKNVPQLVTYTPPPDLFVKDKAEPEADFSFANETLPVDNKRVNFKMYRSLQKSRYKTVQSNILHLKADKLFPIIEPILKAYGIPEDFKFVPLVESGLREGTSPKGARGPWQFMPGTARSYGLKVGRGGDERLNLRKSTIAACRYIKELYSEFNSWTLAAAAYNNGSVKLGRAINKQNEDNYFLMSLNRETGSYVYKLVAMKEVITHPGKYGYKEYVTTVYKPLPLVAFN